MSATFQSADELRELFDGRTLKLASVWPTTSGRPATVVFADVETGEMVGVGSVLGALDARPLAGVQR